MTYRKSGETIRIERWRGRRALVRLMEQGVGEERGRLFRCASSQGASAPPFELSLEEATRLEQSITAAAPAMERLTIVSGSARHSCNGVEWKETHFRVHLALAASGLRVLVDAGASAAAGIDLEHLHAASRALLLHRGSRYEGTVRLRPSVSAQVWPVLLLALAEAPSTLPLRLDQGEHPEYRHDGNGRPITPFVLFDGRRVSPPENWPNMFRPSYRVRPSRAAFHLTAELPAAEAFPEAEAVAVTRPVVASRGRIQGELLCGDGRLFTLDAPASALQGLPRSLPRWFPYAAGSWGTDVIIP